MTEPYPPAVREPPPRSIGRYEVLGLIGEGGQGSVYKVRNPTLDRIEAMKVLKGPSFDEEIQRFRREAQVLGRLRHPNILPVYDVGEIDGRPFYTAEFVSGENLAAMVHRRGPLPPREAMRIGRDLAHALAAAHGQNVTHRDVKPDNVLVDGERILLTDFGLARAHDEQSLTQVTGAIMGTLPYMAPEQAQGQREKVTALSDVYGLGATIYHLLAGRPPFDVGPTLGVLRDVVFRDPVPLTRATAGIPAEVATIVEKCMEKESSRRYASATAAADDIDRYLRGEVILARRASLVTRVAKNVRRNPMAWALGASILCGAAFGVVQLVRQARAQSVQAHIERGRARVERARAASYMKDGDLRGVWAQFPLARAEFEAALDIDPDSAAAWMWIGRSYREEMDYAAAVEALRRAVELDPGLGEAWRELGRALMEGGLQHVRELPEAEQGVALDRAAAEALRCYERAGGGAVDLDGEIAEAYRLVVGRKFEEFEKLARDIEARYGVVPGIEEIDWLRGVSSTTPQERVVHFSRAVERRPGYVAALLERGHNYGELGDHERSLADFDRAVQLKPDDVTSRYNRGNALLNLDRPAEALDDFEAAIARRPDFGSARRNRVSAWIRLGVYDRAVAELEAWAAADPRDVHALNNLGYAYHRLGRHEEAVECCTKALEADASTVAAWINRGDARRSLGHDDLALADYDAALALDPALAETHANRGGILRSKGRLDEAVAAFTAAIELKPANAEFWADRGATWSLLGEVERALADYDEALGRDPALTRTRYNRGCMRLAARRFADAVEDFDVVIAAGEHLIGAHANRGSAKLQLGDESGAADDFRLALEHAPPDYADRGKLEEQLRRLDPDF